MTPEQQRFLVDTYGTIDPLTADVLLSDDGIKHARESMRSGEVGVTPTTLRDRRYYATTARGITSHAITSDGHDERGFALNVRRVNERLDLPWAAVTAHRATLPPAALRRLHEAREEFTRHQRAFPTPYPDLGVRKVGPNGDIHPNDRDLYRQRYEAYQRDVVQPWRQEWRRIRDELTAAVLACLPAAGDDPEPVDLLDHLAAMEATA